MQLTNCRQWDAGRRQLMAGGTGGDVIVASDAGPPQHSLKENE